MVAPLRLSAESSPSLSPGTLQDVLYSEKYISMRSDDGGVVPLDTQLVIYVGLFDALAYVRLPTRLPSMNWLTPLSCVSWVRSLGQIRQSDTMHIYFGQNDIPITSIRHWIKYQTKPLMQREFNRRAATRYTASLKLIHRDVKPVNILVDVREDASGHHLAKVLLGDFGEAKQMRHSMTAGASIAVRAHTLVPKNY